MIKIPNYNVVVPVTPDLRLYTKPRYEYDAERNALTHTVQVTESVAVELPWLPTAQDWVEVYVDGVRLINPRVKNITGGSLFEVYNVTDKVITFEKPITGSLTILCDTQATQHWRSLLINASNVQGFYVYKNVYNFEVANWPVINGNYNGLTYNVYYEPGPDFQSNSYVIIRNCTPTSFNGNFRVINSTPGSVTFRGKIAGRGTMLKPGTIDGFGNATIKELQGISLYTEPVIITQPQHGYARLTGDRQSIAYVPSVGYKGNDTFSWAMINQHGQISSPKCVQIKISDV